uniref:Mos1 transposase HTH domain-containing protein n=1 Tax=Homalodisca liturata TaxID=320908 RepID=A0A1B6JA53_9HEMI
MTEKVEQRYCIKFCVKLGEKQSETIRKIQLAFENEAMSVTQIKEWYNRFKSGRTSAESDARSGRPKTSRTPEIIEKAKVLICENRRMTVEEVSTELDVSFGSAEAILTDDLGLRRVAAKFVPKLLTDEQKQRRLDVAEDMLQCCEDDADFLTSIITGDES